mmetsp:Transcript_38243/g.91347  ORF Transcript_38243/g.91347 Transcript_38243/m.91347 type:complete len:222 (+) Transcript_38243:1751-2416(+)
MRGQLGNRLVSHRLQLRLLHVGQLVLLHLLKLSHKARGHFLRYSQPVANAHLLPMVLIRSSKVIEILCRDGHDGVLEQAGHLKLAQVREQRELHRGCEVDEPNRVQSIDHDVGGVQVSVGKAHQWTQARQVLLGELLEFRLDLIDHQLLEIRHAGAEVALIHLAHGCAGASILELAVRVEVRVLALQRVPAPGKLLLVAVDALLASFTQRGDHAARPKGLS